jgi:hypothetical protein
MSFGPLGGGGFFGRMGNMGPSGPYGAWPGCGCGSGLIFMLAGILLIIGGCFRMMGY